jgi:hypothetical protein
MIMGISILMILEKPAWFKDDYFDLALTYRFDL